MGQIRSRPDFRASEVVSAETGSDLRVLAVSTSSRVLSEPTYQMVPGVQFVPFDAITERLLSDNAPQVILSPLMTREFDCLELAHRLVKAGFSGRYRALAHNVPRPGIIRNEVRASFPDLDFDVLVMGGSVAQPDH